MLVSDSEGDSSIDVRAFRVEITRVEFPRVSFPSQIFATPRLLGTIDNPMMMIDNSNGDNSNNDQFTARILKTQKQFRCFVPQQLSLRNRMLFQVSSEE